MEGKTKDVTIMNTQIIFLGQKFVATTKRLALCSCKILPKVNFSPLLLCLLQTFNCSFAVA